MDTLQSASNKVAIIKTLYLYLVSFVALMILVFAGIDLLNVVLKKYIFTQADADSYYPTVLDCEAEIVPLPPTPERTVTPVPSKPSRAECEQRAEEARLASDRSRIAQRQRDLVRDISMLIVAAPLFAFHWRLARRKE